MTDWRKGYGNCVNCGKALSKYELGKGFIRCPACRQRMKAGYQFGHMDKEPPAAVKLWCENKLWEIQNRCRLQRWPLDANSRCKRCQWIAYVGPDQWFCPLPYCARIYRTQESDNDASLD